MVMAMSLWKPPTPGLWQQRRAEPGNDHLAFPVKHSTFEYLARRLADAGASITDATDAASRTAENALQGDVAIAHPDERMGIKQGKVVGMYSHRPGAMPTLIMAPETEYAEKLKEQIDEMHHYGETNLDRERQTMGPRPDVDADHKDALDQLRAKQAGRRIMGPSPKARHLSH